VTDPEGENRRRHPRVDIPLLVQYRFTALEEFRTDYAINVSRSGLFIETDDSRPIGTRVFVQLTTRDGAHLLQGEGRVVRQAGGGWAIELVGFDDAARAVLDSMVEAALGLLNKSSRTEPGRRRRP
jgi:type IV pilus assembly protein PilZ